jgi:hypothetical protein
MKKQASMSLPKVNNPTIKDLSDSEEKEISIHELKK